MKFNNKKLEKTSKLINFIISAALCGFLILLSAKFIGDIDDWKEPPSIETFQNRVLIEKNDSLIGLIDEKIDVEYVKQNNIETNINIAESDYTNAKQSFDNWLDARQVLGSKSEDKEVVNRANELDEFYKAEQEWHKKQSIINDEIQDLEGQKTEFYDIIQVEEDRAKGLRYKSIQKNDMKVFLIRLLIILPILLIGIFFIIKFRKHKYWPLFFGFVLFSFYAFFIGLVPYLPSYGGYIRYSVGVVIVILLGIYVINKIRTFIEKKRSELSVSSTERAKKVQTTTAEKALEDHMCPSCGKDFIVVGWEKGPQGKRLLHAPVKVAHFCRFCGLELFKKCKTCETVNFVHLPFCSSCGDKVADA